MDRATIESRLQAVEDLVQRMQQNIVVQSRMIATRDRGSHDVKAALMFLKRLEAKQASHVAAQDRLFKELANSF